MQVIGDHTPHSAKASIKANENKAKKTQKMEEQLQITVMNTGRTQDSEVLGSAIQTEIKHQRQGDEIEGEEGHVGKMVLEKVG